MLSFYGSVELAGWTLVFAAKNKNNLVSNIIFFSGSPLYKIIPLSTRDLGLSQAIIHHNNKLARAILDSGISLSSEKSYPKISYAAYYGNLEMAQILLERGANINTSENRGLAYPLYAAVAGNQPKMVEFLISKGSDANKSPIYINTSLLDYASQRHYKEVVQILRNAGAHDKKTIFISDTTDQARSPTSLFPSQP